MHPFSVAEITAPDLPPDTAVREPRPIADEDFAALYRHGGYPEPYLCRESRFSRRWRSTRAARLVREDVRELTGVQQLDQLEVMARFLTERSGEQLVLDNLARQVRVSADTVRRWVAALGDLHLGFLKSGASALSTSTRRAFRVPSDGCGGLCGCGLLRIARSFAGGSGAHVALAATLIGRVATVKGRDKLAMADCQLFPLNRGVAWDKGWRGVENSFSQTFRRQCGRDPRKESKDGTRGEVSEGPVDARDAGAARRGSGNFEWLGGRHLLSVDGTGHFSSPTARCEHCCVKARRDGSRGCYRQPPCGWR